MDEKTVTRTALKLTLVAVVVMAAVAIILAWEQPAQERAEAATGGPEMGLSVPLGKYHHVSLRYAFRPRLHRSW